MASVQILKPKFSPLSVSQSNSLPNPTCFCSKSRNRFLKVRSRRWSSKFFTDRRFRVSCELQEGDGKSNGEEPPESLFMKELKRRGMTPTSLLEESNRSMNEEDINEDASRKKAASTDYERSLSNQRERSMALNSEGLEGLIPRAKVLLTIGATFFLGFWPLILVIVAVFSGLSLYFGTSFVHDAGGSPVAPPQYIDPYELLEEESVYQSTATLN